MLWRLRYYGRRLRAAIQPMRERGLSLATIVFVFVPAATLLRAWRVIAQSANGGPVQRLFNQPRFALFQDGLASSPLPRLYVIVMPYTLHFLLPCLALLRGHAQVVLIGNGARRWERRRLASRYPEMPVFDLWTCPASSVDHGSVITLLLDHHRGDFGIVDHDCYVFDAAVFRQLAPAADECVVGLFPEYSEMATFTYPLTYFLYFNAARLQSAMRRYGVGARLYRQIPDGAREAMARIGLTARIRWKSYQPFFDTLHVLLAVAVAQGLKIRFVASPLDRQPMHVGGTSVGVHHTKGLWAHYLHLRFLERLGDVEISRRYAFLTAPLRSSTEVLERSGRAGPEWDALPIVDELIDRLGRQSGASPV